MSWIRRVLSRWTPEDLPPPVAPSERLDLAKAKVKQAQLLTRANAAIQEAMALADLVFVPPQEADSRRKPR